MIPLRTPFLAAVLLLLTGAWIAPSFAAGTWTPDLDPTAKPGPDDPAKRAADYQPSEVPYTGWKTSGQPERPYFHRYDQSLVMKIFLAEKTDGGKDCKVYLTFEQALETIRRLNCITCGAPKIVYLVGWQYNGHDSKYPAWGEVNARLKRPEDNTALDSLRWLIREGRKHNTTVSLHINMFDAYEDSPLWPDYLAKDIIAKGKDGNPLKGEVFGGQQSYQLSYAREWETGFAKRRIDGLLAMIPELKEGHTLHIDAFHNYPPIPHAYPPGRFPDRDMGFKGISPWLGYGMDKETAAMRKTFRYFRDYGVDISSEGSTFLRSDPHVGLQPMAWNYQAPAGTIPPKLYCGTPMQAEAGIRKDSKSLPGLLDQFCLSAAPWIWANHWRHDDDNKQPMPADWTKTIQGGDSCVPLTWCKVPSLVAYSRNGYKDKAWPLSGPWSNITKARVFRIKPEALTELNPIAIENARIVLSLEPGEGLMIVSQ
jgi:hypothetical protein